MEAAPAAIPPNPKTAAISAITKKIKIQRNIVLSVNGSTKVNSKPYQLLSKPLKAVLGNSWQITKTPLGNTSPKISNLAIKMLTYNSVILNLRVEALYKIASVTMPLVFLYSAKK
tara:strand:- start:205 stop:549 length:345 start_codon:yes stop_codon:yes gene_type:complete